MNLIFLILMPESGIVIVSLSEEKMFLSSLKVFVYSIFLRFLSFNAKKNRELRASKLML